MSWAWGKRPSGMQSRVCEANDAHYQTMQETHMTSIWNSAWDRHHTALALWGVYNRTLTYLRSDSTSLGLCQWHDRTNWKCKAACIKKEFTIAVLLTERWNAVLTYHWRERSDHWKYKAELIIPKARTTIIYETGMELVWSHVWDPQHHTLAIKEFTIGFQLTCGAIEGLIVCVSNMSEATIGNTKQRASSEMRTVS